MKSFKVRLFVAFGITAVVLFGLTGYAFYAMMIEEDYGIALLTLMLVALLGRVLPIPLSWYVTRGRKQ